MSTQALSQSLDTDVAIVGTGPVGTLLAILLGQKGHRVTLVERWPEPYDLPRAVTFDHEIARILSELGIDSDNDSAINYHDELYYWKNAEGENISIVDWQSTSASGWRVRYWFYQPELEKRLRDIAATIPAIRMLSGWEANSLTQDAHGVTLRGLVDRHYNPGQEVLDTIRARYVVGADGANSFVRQALELPITDKGFFYDWLIVDMIPKGDYEMSPAQWQLCDPKRPTTIVPGGPGRRRWEFMALPGETAEELSRDDTVWKLMKPWGMTPENATLERSAVYRFQARWCEQWHQGRAVIAGDAAHLMPPFAGEGMCAGLRDAVALGWRLDGMLSGRFTDAVLESYTSERKEHVKHYIEFSMWLGEIICITDPVEATERDRRMKADLEASGGEPVPTDKAALGPGIWCEDAPYGGELSVQGVVGANGKHDRFDEAVGRGWVVIGLDSYPEEALTSAQLEQLKLLGGRTVRLGAPGTSCDAEDTEGTYAHWLNEIDATYVMVRPDYYVAAAAGSPEALRRQFDEVMQQLHLQASSQQASCCA